MIDKLTFEEIKREGLESRLKAKEKRYDEMKLKEKVALLRESIRAAGEEARKKNLGGSTSTLMENYVDAVKSSLPPDVSFLALGKQSNVFVYREAEKKFAIKLFLQKEEALVEDFGGYDLESFGLPPDPLNAATVQASALELVSDQKSVVRLEAYSSEDEVVVTELLEGGTVFDQQYIGDKIKPNSEQWNDFIKMTITSLRRGLSIDHSGKNVIVTPEADLKILEFYDFRGTENDMVGRLLMAFALINETNKYLTGRQGDAQTNPENDKQVKREGLQALVRNGFTKEAEILTKKYFPDLQAAF